MPSSSRALEPVASLCVGNAEEDEGADAQVDGGADLVDQAIDAELVVARHRGDFFLDAVAGADEQRQDEIVDGERRLADEAADQRMMAQAARTVAGTWSDPYASTSHRAMLLTSR